MSKLIEQSACNTSQYFTLLSYTEWPRPKHVFACITHRGKEYQGKCVNGTHYADNYAAFNLAAHVGDGESEVFKNRQNLSQALKFNRTPIWLNQVHGVEIINVEAGSEPGNDKDDLQTADGSYTNCADTPLAILTADCIPVLMCDAEGVGIAAVHAGWRGLAAGILEEAVSMFATKNLSVYLGPAIAKCHFEVGTPVKRAFPDSNAFTTGGATGHWMFDLFAEAESRLRSMGIKHVYGGKQCTYCDDGQYSYRRDGQCGRFSSLVWR